MSRDRSTCAATAPMPIATHVAPTAAGAGLLASGYGFRYSLVPRRRHRRRHCSRQTPTRRPVGWRSAEHPAGSGLAIHRLVHHRSRIADDGAPQLQPFAVRAADTRLSDLVAVQDSRQARGGIAGQVVLGHPAGIGDASTAGCLHRLRHAAGVADAHAAGDGLQPVHHRSDVYSMAAGGLCDHLVRTRKNQMRSTRCSPA